VIENNVISAYTEGLTIADLEVRYNTISRCGAGFNGVGDYAFIHHNQILDHRFWGIWAYTTLAIIEDNTILRCGLEGVRIEVGYPTLRRNQVFYGATHGIDVSRGFLEGNIVAFNAGDGIRVETAAAATSLIPTVVTGSTIVGNGNNGVVCGYTAGVGSRITNNIIAHNRQYGVDFPSYDLPDLVACNDLYSNSAGTFSGYGAGLDSLNGNIVLNPLFCGPVLPLTVPTDFRLQEGSPCAPGNSGDCGLIGAVSEFCPTVPGKAEEPPSTRRSWGWLKGRYR
jgi:hypothetical protein